MSLDCLLPHNQTYNLISFLFSDVDSEMLFYSVGWLVLFGWFIQILHGKVSLWQQSIKVNIECDGARGT